MNEDLQALQEQVTALKQELEKSTGTVAQMRSELTNALSKLDAVQLEFRSRHDENKQRDETALAHILAIAKKIELGASHRNAIAIQDSRRSLSTLAGVIVAVLLSILLWTTALDERSRRGWAGRLFPVFAGLSIGGIGLLIYSRMGSSEAYQQALTTALHLPDTGTFDPGMAEEPQQPQNDEHSP